MNIFVKNTDFEIVKMVEVFESMIWTDRYQSCGDFELYMPMDEDVLSYIKNDYYLINGNSEHFMIIEELLIKTDIEEGNMLTVSGRSGESIIDRRIVWGLMILSGDLQDAIEALLYDNIINPEDPSRRIDNFIFERTDDPVISYMTIDAQYTGDNLYDIITAICDGLNIGFKITLNDNNQFVFKLYRGTDRSYNQSKNSYVVFSPEFENIINSKYLKNTANKKNVTLIGGEGEGTERKYAQLGDEKGLNRRELFTDARDISSNVDGVDIPESEYALLLIQRGNEKLSEHTEVEAFEGDIESGITFTYGEDYFIGDTVSIANEFGVKSTPQIVEIIESQDETGYSIIPTFRYYHSESYILTEDERIVKTEDNKGILVEDGMGL